MEFDILFKDFTTVNKVVVIGTTIHKFKNIKVDDLYLPCVSYHLPTADILLSPHTYHQMHVRNSSIYAERVDMHFIVHEVVVKIDRK